MICTRFAGNHNFLKIRLEFGFSSIFKCALDSIKYRNETCIKLIHFASENILYR